jgi:hypothetical protein
MRVVAPGSHGLFRLVNRSQLKAAGFATFADYTQDAVRQHPLHRAGSPQPRLREGTVCLNDPSRVQVCLAVWVVSRSETILSTT